MTPCTCWAPWWCSPCPTSSPASTPTLSTSTQSLSSFLWLTFGSQVCHQPIRHFITNCLVKLSRLYLHHNINHFGKVYHSVSSLLQGNYRDIRLVTALTVVRLTISGLPQMVIKEVHPSHHSLLCFIQSTKILWIGAYNLHRCVGDPVKGEKNEEEMSFILHSPIKDVN